MRDYNTSMQLSAAASRRALLTSVLLAGILGVSGCRGSSSRGPNFLGTFPMGERVQAPPFIYNVLEAQWKTELTEGGRAPKHRFLFIRVNATNSGGQSATLPPFQLESQDGSATYQEVMENMDGVPDWLGMIRTVAPGQTERGYAVFDVPMAAYRLLVYDGKDVAEEKYAIVEIPVSLD